MNETESDSETDETKKCKYCKRRFRFRHIADYSDILRHYMEEHPKTETLTNVLQATTVVVECDSCGSEFESSLKNGFGIIGADAYCDECVEADPIRGVFAQELRASEAIQKSR